VEYRFALISFLEGALFVDAGNIWTMNPDPARPGADFEFDRFLSEIAAGAGFGLRFNFDFFIVRLDAGLQVRDPSLDNGERWLFQPKDKYDAYIEGLNAERPSNRQLETYRSRWNLNLGIGYPF
ncbi:MAG: BamA/TamA family outer membrane protein, partial [Cryomorphaceae bacterium]